MTGGRIAPRGLVAALLSVVLYSAVRADTGPFLVSSIVEADAVDARASQPILLRSLVEADAVDARANQPILLRSLIEADAVDARASQPILLRSLIEADAVDARANQPILLRSLIEADAGFAGPPTEVRIVINAGAETTQIREVEILLSAENATHIRFPTEDPRAVDTQPLVALPAADTEGRSETTIPFTLSLGSGTKEIFTRFENAGIPGEVVSDTIEAVFGRPDVVIPSIEFSARPLFPGLPTRVFVRVRNDGSAEARNALVRLSLDGAPLGEVTVETVPSGGLGARATFAWDTPVYGFHLLEAHVEPLAREGDTTNNCRSVVAIVGTFDVAGLVQVQATFGNGLISKQAFTGARVRAIGTARYDPELTAGLPVAGASVIVEDATGRVHGRGITNADGTFDVAFPAPSDVAIYNFRVVVTDGNAGGKSGSLLLDVRTLEGVELVVYPEEVVSELDPVGLMEPDMITAVIHNLGNQGVSNATVRFLDEDLIIADTVIPFIGPRSSATVTIVHEFPFIGQRDVTVVPDPFDVIPEALEALGLDIEGAALDPRVIPNRELEAIDLFISPLTPCPNENVTITARILNLGRQPFGDGSEITYRVPGFADRMVTLIGDIPATSPPSEVSVLPAQVYNIPPDFTSRQIDFEITFTPQVEFFIRNNFYSEPLVIRTDCVATGGGGGSGDGGAGSGGGGSADGTPGDSDIAITRIDILNATFPSDGERIFTNDLIAAVATVQNVGQAPTTATTLNLSINRFGFLPPNPNGTAMVPALNPGEVRQIAITEAAPADMTMSDVYVVTMSLDEIPGEATSLNNTLSRRKGVFRITPPGPRLLLPLVLSASPSGIEGVAVGQPFTATVTLENIGRERTSSMPIHFTVDGETVGTVVVGAVEPGETAIAAHRFSIDQAGFFTIAVEIEVPEDDDIDTTDNKVSRLVAVGGFMDIRLDTFTAPAIGLPGLATPLAVTVRNAGVIGLRGLEVSFHDGPTEASSKLGQLGFDLSPGQTASATFALVAPGSFTDTHTIAAVADPFRFFPEANRADNRLTQTITFPAPPPPPVISSPASDICTRADSILVVGTAEAGTLVRVFTDGLFVGSDVAEGGSFSVSILPFEGSHTLTATTDRNGLVSASSTGVPFMIDRAPPVVGITSPTGGLFVARQDSIVIAFSFTDADPNATATAFLTDLEESTTRAVQNGERIEPLILDDGFWRLTVLARDCGGNEGDAVGSPFEVVHDIMPPRTTLSIGPPNVAVGAETAVKSATPLTLTAVDDLVTLGDGVGLGVAKTFLKIDAGAETEVTTPIAFNLADYDDGAHFVTFRSVDVLGNEEDPQTVTIFLDNTPPATSLTVDITDTSGTVLIPESRITLDAVDGPSGAASGVDSTIFTIDGETVQTYVVPFLPRNLGLALGAHTIAFSSVDRLGNADTTQTFAFTLSPALKVTRRIDHTPRVLVWWNTGETPVASVEAALATGTLSFETVTTRVDFVERLRSAAHNVYLILGASETLSDSHVSELAAHVDIGAGLVTWQYDRLLGPFLDHDRKPGTPAVARDNILGIRAAGDLLDAQTVEVAAGLLSDTPLTFPINGQAERIRDFVDGVEVLGAFTGDMTETPAITLRRYGLGSALFFDFGATSTPEEILGRVSLAVMPETYPVTIGGIVVLAIDMKSLVVPLDLTVNIEELLPAGVTLLSVTPMPQTQQPHLLTWFVVLDVNEETTVRYSFEAPEGLIEAEAIVFYTVRGLFFEFGRFKITVPTVSRDELARTAADSMFAFATTLPTQGGDRQRVEEAAGKIDALDGRVFTSQADMEAAISDVLSAIESVTRTAKPQAEPIRRILEELLAILETEGG